MCTPVTPAVPYLLLGLQDVQWTMGNSRGARKLARTPHVNKKKKQKKEREKFKHMYQVEKKYYKNSRN
jgi:hypothetical protein